MSYCSRPRHNLIRFSLHQSGYTLSPSVTFRNVTAPALNGSWTKQHHFRQGALFTTCVLSICSPGRILIMLCWKAGKPKSHPLSSCIELRQLLSAKPWLRNACSHHFNAKRLERMECVFKTIPCCLKTKRKKAAVQNFLLNFKFICHLWQSASVASLIMQTECCLRLVHFCWIGCIFSSLHVCCFTLLQ